MTRFWALGTQPGGLYPDEAAEGLSAERLLNQPGFHPIFFDDDGGREATFAYVVAITFRLFGASTLTLRATAAALGVLGVAAIWLAVRRFGRWPAIAATAWAAGSLWLICVSRDGFRNVITIGFGALLLAAVLRWGDRPSRRWALVAGAATAAGLWTYQPLKFAPLFVAGWLLWLRHRDRDKYLSLRRDLSWAILAYVVVAAPMGWTAITDAANFFGRAAGVSIFNPGSGSADSYPVHVLKTLGMFIVAGDPNQRHDVNALPLLGPVLFVPFVFGAWRAWRLRRDHAHAALLIGLVVFLIPPLIANEGAAPHFLRTLGLAPFIAALIGIGVRELHRFALVLSLRLRGVMARAARFVTPAAATVALVALGALSCLTYLARPVAERYDAYSFGDVQLAALSARGPGTVVVINDYDAFDVRFLDWNDPPTIIDPGTRLADPSVYSLIVATSKSDIAMAAGNAAAERATVAATDLTGRPAVWTVVP